MCSDKDSRQSWEPVQLRQASDSGLGFELESLELGALFAAGISREYLGSSSLFSIKYGCKQTSKLQALKLETEARV